MKIFKKIYALILISLIYFITNTYSPNVQATQKATISSTVAIIYADPELKIPLGSASEDRKVIIGDHSIKKNEIIVYPIVITDRIGYIKKDDLLLEKDDEYYDDEEEAKPIHVKNDQDTNIDFQIQKRTFYQTDIFVSYQRFSLSGISKGYRLKGVPYPDGSANMLSIYMENWPKESWGISYGFDYLRYTEKENNFFSSSIGLAAGAVFDTYNFRNFDLFTSALLHYFPSYWFSYLDSAGKEQRYSGIMSGYSIGGQLVYGFNRVIDLGLGINYVCLTASSLKNEDNSKRIGSATNKKLSILLSFSYSL
ncbi:MAG: hypothetical protein HQK51_07180 [Oligoflexia bacterium]|nr:hypothetical protein [Oligoflexia bacterium]